MSPDGAARTTSVRLTPLGRTFQLLALTALVGAEVVALGDSSGAGGLRAGTLLFVPLLALLLSWIAPLLAWLALRGLEAEECEPITGLAGDEVVLPLRLRNRSRRFAARDLVVSAGRSQAGVVRPVGFLDELAPRADAVVPLAWRLTRRGRRREVRLALLSSFPFGLAEARLALTLPADVLTLPRPGVLRELPPLPPAGGGTREARRVARSGSADLRGLREWREGEDEHHIHWKVSARRGKRVLRELAGEERGAVRLLLVGAVAQLGESRGDEPPWHEGFERAVTLAATLAQALSARHPVVRLSFLGRSESEAPAVRGRGRVDDLLAFLAEVEPHVGGVAGLGTRAEQVRRQGEVPLVVHAGETAGLALPPGVTRLDADAVAGLYAPARRAALLQLAAGGSA